LLSSVDWQRHAPAVFGCSGQRLTGEERRFFAELRPLGFILFARNCDNPAQVKELVGELRDAAACPEAPVMIDQEGGRVARLKAPHWRLPPPAKPFGLLYAREPKAAREAARLNARLIAHDLEQLGIDVDCAPVLDLPVPDAHDIIGDRAFSEHPEPMAALARAFCEGLQAGGVAPVIKHIPGHGRARADSHVTLPVVETSEKDLAARDWLPFRELNDSPWAMTAHVLYRALDPDRPATVSPKVISRVIRGSIGFDRVLISDDIGMSALGGSFTERSAASLDAGCDVVLHCSGKLDEMRQAADGLKPTGPKTAKRLESALKRARPAPFDRAQALGRLSALLQQAVPAA
jgi:beta-N-acetylhexosaminidase